MERGSSPTFFQEKMEEKMLQSSRSHPSRESCPERPASSPAGKAWCKLTFSLLTLTPCPYACSILLVNCTKRFVLKCSFPIALCSPLCHPHWDGNHPRAGPACCTRASGVSSGTAREHNCKTRSEQYQKQQRAPYGKDGATAHICACLFAPLLDIQVELGWESHFLWKQRGFLCYPSQCRQPQGFVLEPYQPPRLGEQSQGFPG